MSSASRFHHSPNTRSGPSALLTRRREPRQVKLTGGWSGSRATVSMGSGGANNRAGRGQWVGHPSPGSGAAAGTRWTDRSGTSLATGANRGRCTRPALAVGVEEPVHVAVDRLRPGRRACLIDPLLRELLTILPLAATQR